MDTTKTFDEDLRALYSSLPEGLRDMIFAPETSDVYDKLAVKFQLDPKQRDTISQQTTFLFLGLRNPQTLVTALATSLAIERDKASLIAQDLNRDLFYKVKDELKALYLQPGEQAPQPSPAVPPATGTPTVSTPTPPPAPTPDPEGLKPHIGNIFEEKLGGAFRVKSDAVQYSTPPTTPEPAQVAPPPRAPAADPYRELPV